MPTKLSNSFFALGCLSPIIGVSLFIYLLFNQSILSAFIYLGLFAIITVILWVIVALMEVDRKAKQKHQLSTLLPEAGNYDETQSYIAYDLLSKIMVDDVNKRIYFWVPEDNEVQTIKDISYGMPYQMFNYPYSALLAIQIIEDSSSISTVSRQSESARLVLDGFEPINDQPAPNNPNNERIHSMELKLIMKDPVRPIQIVRFYTDPNASLNKNTPEYRRAQNDIEQWFTILHFIIKDTDQKEGYYYAREDKIQQSKLEKVEIQVLSSANDENGAFVKAQLLSVLNQVIYKKIVEYPSQKKIDDSPQQIERSTSYFDKLLEKNRRQLHGEQIDE